MVVYIVLQLGYCFGWKHQPVIDIALVSSGFMLCAIKERMNYCGKNFIKYDVPKTLILVGDNDLEFLFDYACRFCKLVFIKIDSEHFFNDRFFVIDDAVIVFSDENYYEAGGRLVWASDPYPGSMHDAAALDASGLLDGIDPSGLFMSWDASKFRRPLPLRCIPAL